MGDRITAFTVLASCRLATYLFIIWFILSPGGARIGAALGICHTAISNSVKSSCAFCAFSCFVRSASGTSGGCAIRTGASVCNACLSSIGRTKTRIARFTRSIYWIRAWIRHYPIGTGARICHTRLSSVRCIKIGFTHRTGPVGSICFAIRNVLHT